MALLGRIVRSAALFGAGFATAAWLGRRKLRHALRLGSVLTEAESIAG
jgi:hypothetical protein